MATRMMAVLGMLATLFMAACAPAPAPAPTPAPADASAPAPEPAVTPAAAVATTAVPAPVIGNPEKVKLVEAGQLKEARAEWWGFDPVDSTKQLQAAINSGVKKLIIPKMETPWIVNPIFLVSNQEIVLEPGTVIEAIRGGFHGRTDHLLSAREKQNISIIGKDATLLMHKADYLDATKYQRAEWRHTLAFYGCENILVQGLTMRSSGGDGIYISSAGRQKDYCKDVTIRDCVMDDHNRQGISVISVENLLIENCTMQNTRGSAPQAGIDFEPNAPGQRLVNITMRNCTFKDNASAGVIIHTYVRKDSTPISFKFENCTAINDNFTAFLGDGDADGEPLFDKINITMTNCTETNRGRTRTINDFWADVMNIQVLTDAQKAIMAKLQRVPVKGAKLIPIPGAGARTIQALPTVRGASCAIAYLQKGQTLAFSALMDRETAGMSVSVIAPSGQEKMLAEKVPVGETRDIAFQAEESGIYIIKFGLRSGWVDIKAKPESDAGLALVALENRIHVFRNGVELYFYVPAGVENFCARVAGEGSERVKASLYNPAGEVVGTGDNISTPHKLIASRAANAPAEIWKLKTERPSGGSMEDYYIDLVGVPPIFAADKACLLVPAE